MGDFPFGVSLLPINGNVVVELLSNPTMTDGKIIIPETIQNRPILGVVRELSNGYIEGQVFKSHELAIGDEVVFNYKSGYDIRIGDRDFRVLHERDIVAIIREEI